MRELIEIVKHLQGQITQIDKRIDAEVRRIDSEVERQVLRHLRGVRRNDSDLGEGDG